MAAGLYQGRRDDPDTARPIVTESSARLPRLLDRYPFNSPWVARVVSRYWLQAWFTIESVGALIQAAMDTRHIFFDARLYLAATRAWLDGGDPWQVHIAGNYFAAPPPSLLPLVPLAWLPADFGYLIVAVAVLVAAVATVRMLDLPWWWILFPPLVQCVLSANVQGLLIPLILVRAGPIAALLKIYAAVPLLILGRWRSLLVLGVALVASLAVLPWALFMSNFELIGSRLSEQNEHGLPNIVLIVLAPAILAALYVVGREKAAWLAVPAFWPTQQFYYGTLVMPARSKVAAAIVALPVAGSGTVALFVVALLAWRRRGPHPVDRPWRMRRIDVRRADHGIGGQDVDGPS